ncbi:MAG TPA: hypothetical protein VEP73_11870, partial [Actinomycetota bacterium]|nr:hypothetical protein [Actinomycetota bacterium]
MARQIAENEGEQRATATAVGRARQRHRDLEDSPEARSHQQVLALGERAAELVAHAGKARRHAQDARGRAGKAGQRAEHDAASLRRDVTGLAASGQSAAEFAALGLPALVIVPAVLLDPAMLDDMPVLDQALAGHARAAGAARPRVGERQAAVRVVEEARRGAERAESQRRSAEERAAELEGAAQDERVRLAAAERQARSAQESFEADLAAWRADDRAVPVEIPDELTEQAVQRLGGIAREAADPLLRELAVAGDRAASERAGLEAALESSGLLDAWVRVDGQVLGADQRDVVLPLGPAVPGRSLADLLIVDCPGDCPVSAATIRGVLARIAPCGTGGTGATGASAVGGASSVGGTSEPNGTDETDETGAVVGTDGRWRLGPLTGRAAKPAAQYIGATARAAERARRLAEVDRIAEATRHARDAAAAAEEAARGRRSAIEAWLGAVPPFGELLAATADARACAVASARAEQAARAAEEAARQARAAAAAA